MKTIANLVSDDRPKNPLLYTFSKDIVVLYVIFCSYFGYLIVFKTSKLFRNIMILNHFYRGWRGSSIFSISLEKGEIFSNELLLAT